LQEIFIDRAAPLARHRTVGPIDRGGVRHGVSILARVAIHFLSFFLSFFLFAIQVHSVHILGGASACMREGEGANHRGVAAAPAGVRGGRRRRPADQLARAAHDVQTRIDEKTSGSC